MFNNFKFYNLPEARWKAGHRMILRWEAGGKWVEGGVGLQPVGGWVAPHFWTRKVVEGAAAGGGGRSASGRDHGRLGKALQKISQVENFNRYAADRSDFRGKKFIHRSSHRYHRFALLRI
jgi:hypothetical protein